MIAVAWMVLVGFPVVRAETPTAGPAAPDECGAALEALAHVPAEQIGEKLLTLADVCGPGASRAGVPGVMELDVPCAAGSGVGTVQGVLSVNGRDIVFREEAAAGAWDSTNSRGAGLSLGAIATNGPGAALIGGVPVPAWTTFTVSCMMKNVWPNPPACNPFTHTCYNAQLEFGCDMYSTATIISVPGVASAYVTMHLHNPGCDE